MPKIVFMCRFCREKREAVVAIERGEYIQVTCERGHTQFISRKEARLSGG